MPPALSTLRRGHTAPYAWINSNSEKLIIVEQFCPNANLSNVSQKRVHIILFARHRLLAPYRETFVE